MLSVFPKLVRWRRPALGLAALAFEAVLLFSPDLSFNGNLFPLLCCLTCWLPAWLCADLLSIHTRTNPEPHREWAPREFLARARGRLGLFFPVLAVWVSTWTARSVMEDLKSPPNGLFNVVDPKSATAAIFVWLAWTAVFLASALAYAAGAAMLSGLCRRPRRWLLVPLLVVGVSFVAMAAIGALIPPSSPGLPSITAPLSNWQAFLVFPNYTLGITTALAMGNQIDALPEPTRQAISQVIGRGLAPFSWLATCFFLLITAGAVSITWWVAHRRHRRHPYTVTREMAVEAAPALQPEVTVSAPQMPAAVPEPAEQCLST